MTTIVIILSIITALGIYNVWFVRPRIATDYRGRGTKTLRQEFAAYGLPSWAVYVIGTLKVLAATALIVGIWVPVLTLPAAVLLAVLMLGAIAMHIKVNDPVKHSVPAIGMLVMSVAIVVLVLV